MGRRLQTQKRHSFCHFATASWEERGCTIMDPVPSCPLEPLPQEYILSKSSCHDQTESEKGPGEAKPECTSSSKALRPVPQVTSFLRAQAGSLQSR